MSKINWGKILKYILFFIFIYVFFTQICPIIPYEGDDWYFIGSLRQPIPYADAFNPSKVMPEVLEPICGYISAFLIYPITHDYVGSLSIGATGCISLIIVIMFYLFNKVLVDRYKISKEKAFVYELLFIILFFVIFKMENQSSPYGFWSKTYNCYFNYLVPGLVNACAVLLMMSYTDFQDGFNKMSNIKKGLFLILVYFASFSSIQLNIILSSYAFVCLLTNLFKKSKKKDKFKTKVLSFLKSSWIYIVILLTWVVSVLFDLTGKRGGMLENPNWLSFSNFKITAKTIYNTYSFIYKPLLYIVLISFILIVGYVIWKRKEVKNYLTFYIYYLILLGLNVSYLIIMYMKAGYGYGTRIDATWGILFYLIMLFMGTVVMCNKYIQITEISIPIMVVLLSIVAFNMNFHFYQSVFDAKTAINVDNYIINQIIEADERGDSSVKVIVPKMADQGSNWPIPYNMAMWLQNALYAHRITRNRMYIVFEPSEKAYKELYTKDFSNMFFFDFERDKYLK